MLLLTGGFRLVVVIAVVAIALGPRPASAAEDVAKAVEKQVGEQVRVVTHDALGFPKKIRGTRADTRYEADFDDVFEDMARTGKWPLNTDKVMNQRTLSLLLLLSLSLFSSLLSFSLGSENVVIFNHSCILNGL